MKSQVEKHSIIINGRKTSISLESAFLYGLKEIAKARRLTLSMLVDEIDAARTHANLSSELRLYVLAFYRQAYRGTYAGPLETAA